jgi:hypothetical protein
MTQKAVIIFFYFLHYYNSYAFYKPFTPSVFYTKKNYYLLNSKNKENNINELDNNDSEIDTTGKTFNKTFRLGRSKDQDGKSNIWSVEPKMEVVNEELTELNKNILTGGLLFTGFLASLPLLYTLNQYIKNIDY